jgi:hypothetical protein
MAPWSKKMKSFIRVEEKIYEHEKNLINSNHMLVPTTLFTMFNDIVNFLFPHNKTNLVYKNQSRIG